MNKIIGLFAIIVVSVFGSFAQSPERVKIETYGFDNNQQSLLFVSKYAKQSNPDGWKLVRSNPELVMQVTAKVKRNRSWSAIDWEARNRNNQLKAIDRQSQRAVNRVPYKWGNGWGRIGIQITRDLMISRYVDNKYQIEKYWYEELTATVEVLVYDPSTCVRKRCDILYSAIGVNDIVVKTAKMSGYEPVTFLEQGDLSAVGMTSTDNLGKSYRQILALSAFMESEKSENQIGFE